MSVSRGGFSVVVRTSASQATGIDQSSQVAARISVELVFLGDFRLIATGLGP
jgi:hypothetical protein